jgi:2-polyprenyl-6-methoxyphenol hydroxylase-like FAD-dependent oxidoreductase
LSRIETNVLIVGAGPVGLTLAMDLAWRGIDVIIVERREASAQPAFKCNQISSRSMEIFRRLGIAAKLREAGLPADYPNDAVSTTTVTGIELARIPIPCRAERFTSRNGPDTSWPTPEPTHRINQIFFEPILFECAAANPRIRILNGTTIEHFVQDEHGVTAAACHVGSGERSSIACRYLVGCDGARSTVRKAIGARLAGTPELQRIQSTCVRAPELIKLLPGKPAWIYFALNPRCCGNVIAIDGRETWIVSYALPDGEREFGSIDHDWAIRAVLGVAAEFQYDVISNEAWTGRRLVADRFRDRRVFICGDAAHLWMPMGGYGMNAGIADAANLSWLIAATLNRWAPPSILDAYEAERQPVTDQVSRFTMDSATRIMKQRCAIPNEIESPGPIGDAIRRQLGKEAYELDLDRQCCGGLNFGYFYEQSPIIAYDGEPQPSYTMHDFTSSTVPGCRAPHLWLGNGRSLYDALGPGYTLVRFAPTVQISGLMEAAARRGVPLTVLDVSDPDARALYARELVLVRPDQHVAWRANEEPSAPMELIDMVRGARVTGTDRGMRSGA